MPSKNKSKKPAPKKSAHASKKVRSERAPSGKAVPDTFQRWIDNQQKQWLKHPASTLAGKQPLDMPLDTMHEWLRKQPPVVEAEVVVSENLVGSNEEWLRKQVSERISKESMEVMEQTASSEAHTES